MSKIITKSELVLAGIAVLGLCYTPVVHKKPTAEMIANYVHAKWYNPQISYKDWERSEARKQAIQQSLQKITAIRHQIRTQAEVEVYRRDHGTRIVAKTPEQKRLLHAEILLTRLANMKGC